MRQVVWQKFTDVLEVLAASTKAMCKPRRNTSISETSVNFYQSARRYNPEDSHLHSHRRIVTLLILDKHDLLVKK
jgi:hypothetical protein